MAVGVGIFGPGGSTFATKVNFCPGGSTFVRSQKRSHFVILSGTDAPRSEPPQVAAATQKKKKNPASREIATISDDTVDTRPSEDPERADTAVTSEAAKETHTHDTASKAPNSKRPKKDDTNKVAPSAPKGPPKLLLYRRVKRSLRLYSGGSPQSCKDRLQSFWCCSNCCLQSENSRLTCSQKQ